MGLSKSITLFLGLLRDRDRPRDSGKQEHEDGSLCNGDVYVIRYKTSAMFVFQEI